MEQGEKRVPMKGIDYPDRETFERIWHKVMPDQSLSPIVVGQEVALPVHNLQQGDVRGAESHIYMLETMIDGMTLQRRHLQHISKRTTGATVRALTALAEREERQICQLSALYFLMTGLFHRCPVEKLPRGDTLTALLRKIYLQEEKWHGALLLLSQEWGDSCFYEVLIELSRGTEAQCRDICAILARLSCR